MKTGLSDKKTGLLEPNRSNHVPSISYKVSTQIRLWLLVAAIICSVYQHFSINQLVDCYISCLSIGWTHSLSINDRPCTSSEMNRFSNSKQWQTTSEVSVRFFKIKSFCPTSSSKTIRQLGCASLTICLWTTWARCLIVKYFVWLGDVLRSAQN